ncbi:MAG: hypothetical protein Q3987_07765 [Oscillospiraceae bacterium]|nr:hypothetical protein [Oscillospiraceae bacterium]
MEKLKSFFNKDHMVKRILMSIFGVLICGVAVGFFKRAMFGVDPFQSLMSGLDSIIPIDFGTLYVIVNVVMLLFSLIFDRHYIGLATFINLFLIGYIAEFSLNTLEKFFPALGIPGRSVCLIIGILIICVASSFYMTADIGVSTYDAVALIISNTWHVGKFKYVRIVTDVICVILGVALYFLSGSPVSGIGAVVGAGTIITAFFMGPLVDFFARKLAKPFLYGKGQEGT